MKFPSLVRRRSVPVPTWWGWMVLLAAAVALCIVVGATLYPFLAANEPVGARTLVVEGWLGPKQLNEAAKIFRAGGHERVLTTGGPIQSWPNFPGHASYAERAADYLVQNGIPAAAVHAVPAPKSAQDRTYLSALMVREWARRSGVELKALDVFSEGAHARRSRMLYRLAFGPGVDIGVHAAKPDDFDPKRWWRTSVGFRNVFNEAIGLVWFKVFFWPSKEEFRNL